jgi:outer membrane receptor protein involved in Fe transport
VNNISHTRGRGAGLTAQATRTRMLLNRDNHLIAGASVDVARTEFEFASELARLTPDRGTVGSGIFDDDQNVGLHSRTLTASAFVTNTWSLSEAIAVSGSARVNRSTVRLRDQIGTALTGDHVFARVNPAAGVTYQLHPRLNLFGSYGQSSRVPTPVELTCADPEDPCRLPNAFVSDPPLQQVVARTWEAGLRGTTAGGRWSMAAFLTSATDDIIFVSSGTLRGEGHFENISRTRRRGIEASVDQTYGRLTAFASYTLQQATFDTGLTIASPNHPRAVFAEIPVERGDRLPGIPRHSGKLGLIVTPAERLTLGATARMQSAQHFRGDEGNLLPQVDGFTLVNLHGRHRLSQRLAIAAQAQNLLDARYATFGVLGDASILGDEADDPRFYSPGSPRAAWVGLEIQF